VSVICGQQQVDLIGVRSAKPSLVAEILSPSTRAYDLGVKRLEYQRIPSLRYMLFIDSTAVLALVYARGRDGVWPEEPEGFSSSSDSLQLQEWDLDVPLATLYRATGLLEQ